MMTIFLFFSLFSIAFSQKLINLSDFHGDNAINELNLPAPYSIYISANPDSDALLSNIFIINDDGTKTSLYTLKNNKNSDGLKRYIVQKSSYLTTSSSTDQMKTLKGVMYISSPKQANDINFHVIDIDRAHYVQFQVLGAFNNTILFLNTHVDTNPIRSSIISQWQQNEDASVFIFDGYPKDTDEAENTQIFSNPMHTDKFDKFFPTVETFSVSMVAFYLKTYKGGVNFIIEPGYYSIDKSTTSAYTTTGFYMKPLITDDSLVTITTKRDKRYSGSTGANIRGFFFSRVTVTVAEYGGPYDDQFSSPPFNTINSWVTPNIGEILSISSSPIGANVQYYVQYFVIQGQQTSGTTSLSGRQTTANPGIPTLPVNPTWHHVETTTKSSGIVQILISLVISFMVFIGFY